MGLGHSSFLKPEGLWPATGKTLSELLVKTVFQEIIFEFEKMYAPVDKTLISLNCSRLMEPQGPVNLYK